MAKLEKEKEKKFTEAKPDKPKPITEVPKVEIVESIEEIKFCKPTSSLDLGSGSVIKIFKVVELLTFFLKILIFFENHYKERDWRSMKTKAQKADYLRFINDAGLTARCFTSQLPKYIVDICRLVFVYKISYSIWRISGSLIVVRFCFFVIKLIFEAKSNRPGFE